MKKILSLLLLVCTFTTTTIAQDNEYRKELNELFNLGWGTSSNGQLDEKAYSSIFLLQLNEMPNCPYTTPTAKAEAAQRLAKKYVEERGLNDIIDIVMPAYQKHMTISDLKETNNLLKTDTRLFTTGNKLADKSIIEQMTMTLMTQMIGSMQKIAQGEKPESIITEQEKKDPLYIAVTDYCTASGLTSSTMSTLMSGFTSAMEQQDEQQKKIMQSIFEYIIGELPAAYYKGCKGRISAEDIEYVTKFYKTPLGQKLTAGAMEAMNDPIGLANNLMQRTSEWLGKQDLK